MPKKLVAYYRVSTAKQEASGLGLDGQRAAVAEYVRSTGGKVIAVFEETESGKRAKHNPELTRALAHARPAKATLVIAKLDRLARNVAFLANLMEAGTPFVCCDNPNANPLTIHILAAVAEDEAKRISARTIAALAAYKARGGRLGASLPQCRNLTAAARAKGHERGIAGGQAARAAQAAAVGPEVLELHAAGRSLREIAAELNGRGYVTRRGKPWHPTAVLRLLNRAGPPVCPVNR